MRKRLALAALALAFLGALGGHAAGQGDEHNCAGAASSAGAQAAGSFFGDTVSDFAQLQFVDNFGFANCGGAEGQNP